MHRPSGSRTTPRRFRCNRHCWIVTYPAAAAIARRAVGDSTIPPAFVRYGAIEGAARTIRLIFARQNVWAKTFRWDQKAASRRAIIFQWTANMLLRFVCSEAWDSVIRGLNVPTQFEIRMDGKRVWQVHAGWGKATAEELSV